MDSIEEILFSAIQLTEALHKKVLVLSMKKSYTHKARSCAAKGESEVESDFCCNFSLSISHAADCKKAIMR